MSASPHLATLYADDRLGLRCLVGVDDTEDVPLWVSQDDKVGIVWVVLVDPLSAERDETVHLGQLFRFVGGPQVEMCPVVRSRGPARAPAQGTSG